MLPAPQQHPVASGITEFDTQKHSTYICMWSWWLHFTILGLLVALVKLNKMQKPPTHQYQQYWYQPTLHDQSHNPLPWPHLPMMIPLVWRAHDLMSWMNHPFYQYLQWSTAHHGHHHTESTGTQPMLIWPNPGPSTNSTQNHHKHKNLAPMGKIYFDPHRNIFLQCGS